MSPKKGGALRNQSTGGRRLGVAAGICGALFAAPLLLLQSASAHASRPQAAAGSAPEKQDHRSAIVFAPRWCEVAVAPCRVSSADHDVDDRGRGYDDERTSDHDDDSTAPPTTTTTTAPPPPPTTTTTTAPPPPPAPTNSEGGEATWYAAAPDGYCASPTLPFGTVLTVVNNATGASTVCTVDDREAAGYPHVVDMSPEGFSQIADLEPGSGGRHNLLVTLSGADIAQLLSAHGLQPSRALGQNFVADPNTVRRIARLSGAGPGSTCSRSGPAWGR